MTAAPHSVQPGTALLPCPFCGSEAAKIGPYGKELLFGIQCLTCCAEMRGFDQSQQDAIDAWNARATLSQPQGADTRDQCTRPHLGLATTRELLDEIRARIEMHATGGLDYRTVDGESFDTFSRSSTATEGARP